MKVFLFLLLVSLASGFLPFNDGIRIRSSLVVAVSDSDYEDESQSSSKRIRRPTRIRPKRPSKVDGGSGGNIESRIKEAQARHQEALQDPTLLSNTKFSDRSDINPALKRGITEVLGLQTMTQIQAKVYQEALSGDSILGRSKTGTGKTLAFLLPVVERLLAFDPDMYRPGKNIGIIVVAPTRELAIQIADQAKSLTTYLNDFEVACIYGGTKMQRDMRMLSPRLPSILVATPGRLLVHLENTRVERQKFSDIAEDTNIIVLDEADRLFESFPKEINTILSFLPRATKRQTLLFSATMPKRFRFFLRENMKIDYKEIDCVESDRSSRKSETNLRAQQFFHQLDSMEHYVPALVGLIQREMKKEKDYKIIVFFPAGRLVRFFSQFFSIGLEIPVLEIHSRMSQASRNRASTTFRNMKRGILFTSDVSARGIDYPGISLVVQYGTPSSRSNYIHRLGRTARAGRQGQGLLIALPFEEKQLDSITRFDLHLDSGDFSALDHKTNEMVETAKSKIKSGHAVLTTNAEAACKAFLSYYSGYGSLKPADVVRYSEEFALGIGLSTVPPVESKVAERLGVQGLVNEI
ncbi:unnamed protein product [Cylindrotheca closterium]|uniref:ATP-dependent RNA helicase n=1 Tax=Cylindrotheca closterium TaxID=2856 RepID=A0AAD2CSS6_9STRA|nr:unnamed protein product [Cylindrotheca closterium]